MFQKDFFSVHPYANDVFEWLRERRRFSNIRHPFRKFDFESNILNEVCAGLGSSLFDKQTPAVPATDCLLSKPEHLLAYVQSLCANHKSPGCLEIGIKKAWLEEDEKKQFKIKLEALLAEFEKSTSILGEPLSILTIQTDG